MADLIERLRTRVRGGQDGTRLEAAREIERLRAQVEELSDAFTVLWVTANRDEWDGKAVEKFDDILERNGGGEILLLPANAKVSGAGTASAGLPGCASKGNYEERTEK